MRAVDLIAAKRDRRELSAGEIAWLVQGFTSGDIPDYQVSAWLMAVCLNGMSPRETADLTVAMVASGQRLDLSSVTPFVADKHSTGGVGDKTTLVVGPLVAAAGVPVGKMSGRGLGFSGGTLDKLESIPGFRVELTPEEFSRSVAEVGLVVASQSPDLAPADGRLYALRDVTATVESVPLIASSIMSKKIAGGASAVALDVKVGRGAFMKSIDSARALAIAMRDIGSEVGLPVRAILSGMDQPLGWAVGNALEVNEAVATLKGEGPPDLVEVAFTIGAHLLQMAGKAASLQEGRGRLQEALESGEALERFRRFVQHQGGDAGFIEEPARLPQAPVRLEVTAGEPGYVQSIDAEAVGRLTVEMGAGRAVKGAPIDHAVGFIFHKKVGDAVAADDVLAEVHASSQDSGEAARKALRSAFALSPSPVAPPPVVLEVIE